MHRKKFCQKTLLFGVLYATVSVNDVEQGRAVVSRKRGRYSLKVRLSPGPNTIMVTVTKGEETLSVTKVVEKI